MSHAVEADDSGPNLVPLLDLVFQLLMFFIICANFKDKELNSQDVVLPHAQSARPIDKAEVDVLFLNIDQEGKLIVMGREQPLRTLAEIQYYLQQEHKAAEDFAKAKGDPTGEVKTMVIIRAHQLADYAQVYNVLRACKTVGFRKLQVRAIQQTTQG